MMKPTLQEMLARAKARRVMDVQQKYPFGLDRVHFPTLEDVKSRLDRDGYKEADIKKLHIVVYLEVEAECVEVKT